MSIPGGNLKYLKRLLAGPVNIWIHDKGASPAISSNNGSVKTGIDSSTTSLVVNGTGDFEANDIIENLNTREKVYVSAVSVSADDTLTIVRGVEGRSALPFTAGDPLVVVAKGLKITGSLDTTTSTSLPITDDNNLDAADFIIRPNFSIDSDERIHVTALGTDTLTTVIRDFNLHKAKSVYTYSYSANSVWVVEYERFNNPYANDFEATANTNGWLKLLTDGDTTFTPEISTISTHANEIGEGPSFLDNQSFTLSFTSPITDAEFLSYLNPSLYNITDNGLMKGTSLNSDEGIEIQGIHCFIKGKESQKPMMGFFYNATLASTGGVNLGKGQRGMDINLRIAVDEGMGVNGSYAIPSPQA